MERGHLRRTSGPSYHGGCSQLKLSRKKKHSELTLLPFLWSLTVLHIGSTQLEPTSQRAWYSQYRADPQTWANLKNITDWPEEQQKIWAWTIVSFPFATNSASFDSNIFWHLTFSKNNSKNELQVTNFLSPPCLNIQVSSLPTSFPKIYY